jgi:DNA-binding GntR family transcriptional regulator
MNLSMPTGHRATIAERVALSLRDDILRGTLRAGTALREEELAKQFDISRHVVREVLRLLAADGMANYSSFRGSRVVLLSTDDVREIYQARRFIELHSLEKPNGLPELLQLQNIHKSFVQAVKQRQWSEAFDLDLAFHAVLVEVNQNKSISEWHSSLTRRLRLAHLISPMFQEEGLKRSIAEHAAIVQAVATGELAKVRTALEIHLRNAEQQLTELMVQELV